ncbi:MAG: hypothetical protein A2Z30_05170 [Chloroflexi bacterium RBG_16_64_43]|nr:MAG: hypothetical protein A2Z30_05170 [Chloroflexi bacterium RBG_16_64_43]
MAMVILPAPLRPYAAGQKEVSVNGSTVADALSDLTRQHPALHQHIFDERGDLRAFVHLFVDGEELESAVHDKVSLASGARLTLLPSIAGGYTAA